MNGSRPIRLMRFTIGRWLIHAGIAIFPRGRVKPELLEILEQWSAHVRTTALNEKENA